MKKNTFIAVLCIMLQYIQAQTSLKGTIKAKEDNSVLPGATIYLPELKSGTLSKADGSFEFKSLPKTNTLLQVQLLGYKPVLVKINTRDTGLIVIKLEESAVEAQEVVVTGASHLTEIKRNPVPVISIDYKTLTQNTSSNIIDAMIKVPGVSALSTGPNVSKPYIRGLGYNRVLTLFDGVRQDGQQWGDEHGIEVDQYLVDHIEVVKGPASLIYGSDALAGVVNLIPANPVPNNTIKGDVQANYQTNNKQNAESFALAGNENGFVWGLRGSHKQAADYQNKYDGRVFGTKYNENDANIYAGLNKSWGYTHLNFSAYDNVQEIPDGSRDSSTRKFTRQVDEAGTQQIAAQSELNSYGIAAIHQRVQHYRLYADNKFIFGRARLGIRLGAQQSIRREFSHPLATETPGLYLKLNTYSYDIKFYLPEWKKLETTIGVNGMFQENKNPQSATEFVIPDYHSFDAGPFIYLKRSFGKLDIAGGARYDVRVFNNDGLYTTTDPSSGFDTRVSYNPNDTTQAQQFTSYNHTFSGFSGSAGATYNFSERFGLKVNIGRGYRAPNIAEISAKGIHPGTGFEQLGDANLKPEFSLQEDIGMFYENRHVSVNAEVFNNIISNYIFNQKLSAASGGDSMVIQGGAAYPVFKFRQTMTQLYGGEVRIDIHPHPLDWLHFENAASMIWATNLGGNGAMINDSNKYLPYIPPFHTNSELRAEFRKKRGCFSDIFLKVGYQYFAAQNRAFLAYGTETKTPGYGLFDAGMGASVVNKKGKILFTLGIFGSNLTDVAYQSNMSRLKYFDNYPNNYTGRSGIYNMGRNISFKLTIPIGG